MRDLATVLTLLSFGCGAGGCGAKHPPTPPAGIDMATAGTGANHEPPDDMAAMVSPTGDMAMTPEPQDMAKAPPPDFAHISNPANFRVFDSIPMFGMYTNQNPANYTPPAGVLMWQFGTIFVTKLTAQQQTMIGSDLAARITYLAQCDNYDRLGGVFVVLKPIGQVPQPSDPRIELVRFITPFSDYKRGMLATHVYPDYSLAPFAGVLADGGHDVWIGIGGGSNPYNGDPCTNAGVSSDFAAIGFKYSLDFVSSKVLPGGPSAALTAFYNPNATTIPMAGTFSNTGADIDGHVTVIVSGHGADSGGDEYEYTQDTVTFNGSKIGTFSTQIDCAPFAQYSPDGNPGIFQNNGNGNPRNWCPGALVPAHTYGATLHAGGNSVSLDVQPSQVPGGSYYATSIVFTAP
jgi:hypothetical protein